MQDKGIRNHISPVIKPNVTNTQTANATAMGTSSSSGTDEGTMRTRLNAMLTGKTYKMDYIDNFTQNEFIEYVQNSLESNDLVILMIHSPFLSYYPNSYTYTSNHYVVITECIKSGNTITFTVNDPNIVNSVYGTFSGLSASDLLENSYVILWS